MVDEWAEIEKKIYSPHLVFTHGQGGGARGDDLPEKLTSEQELIYQLVDGVRTAEEIIDRSLLGRFNTSEILNGLLEMGLIEVGGVQTPNLVKKVSKINLRDALGFVYYGGFLLFILFLFVYFKPSLLHHVRDSRIASVEFEIPVQYAQEVQLHRVQEALEIYYLEKGQYPDRLDAVVTAGLLDPVDLFYRKGISYGYERKDGQYLLKH
jgi:hypothetical protein